MREKKGEGERNKMVREKGEEGGEKMGEWDDREGFRREIEVRQQEKVRKES